MVMAVLESMPVAARPTPNRPTAMPPSAAAFGNAMLPKVYAPMMASATSTMGAMVDSMPVPMPSMMTVAAPVSAGFGDLVDRLVLVGAEVLGDLADGKAGDQAAQHRAEQPQRLSLDRLGIPDGEQAKITTISMPAAT